MDRRRAIPMLAAALLAAACDPMQERPGHDFAVRVLAQERIEVTGKIYAPVPFAVDGCESFTLAVRDPSGTLRTLAHQERSDGTFEADVPMAWMRAPGPCRDSGSDAKALLDAELVVTCADGQRTARATFSLRVSTAAWANVVSEYPVRAIFPGVDPLGPSFIAANEFGGEFALAPGRAFPIPLSPQPDWANSRNNPLVRPRMAQAGRRAFVTLGCPSSGYCPVLSFGDVTAPAFATERIAELLLDDGGTLLAETLVPTPIIDIAYAPDGALVVLSAPMFWYGGKTVLTRVEPAPEDGSGGNAVTLLADLPGEAVTRFSRTPTGALAFLARSSAQNPSDTVNLLVTDGAAVTATLSVPGVASPNPLTGEVYTGWAQLSPDASTLLLSTPGDDPPWTFSTWAMRTDPADPERHPLPPSGWSAASSAVGTTTWIPGAMALWRGDNLWAPTHSYDLSSAVFLYDDAPPHAFRREYDVEPLDGATGQPVLVGVTAVADKLVLTTTTGVRIYDRDGNLVGGSDPFPCGATTTATAEQVGPTTFGVGAGRLLYVFDVSKL